MPWFLLINYLLLCASPSTCPAKDTGKNIYAGQFPDMLGIEEGIKRRKEIEEAIHPPDHKMPCLAGELPGEKITAQGPSAIPWVFPHKLLQNFNIFIDFLIKNIYYLDKNTC